MDQVVSAPQYKMATKPYQHQIDYLKRSRWKAAYALFSDMGTGKTKMLLDEMGMLHAEELLDSVLITSGKGNYKTWVGEIRKHLHRDTDALVCVWDGADTVRSRMERQAFLKDTPRLRILLVNIEGIASSDRCYTFVKQFLATSRRRMAVVDESTLIKNHEAVRTCRMQVLGHACEFRRIATGNPTPNSPLDLWGQFEFLGGRLLGHSSFFSFRARYAVLSDVHIGNGRTRKVVVAHKNLDELNRVLAGHAYRVRKEDCLDLPPKVYQIREVEFHPQQRKMYQDMKKLALATLNEAGDQASSSMVVGQMSKMHQILCGQVIDDDGVVREVPTMRMEALLDTVRESGRQTIVWCAYRSNVRAVAHALREEFGPGCVSEFYGDTSSDARQRAIDDFQEGRTHFFVATPHTAGRGLTLTAAKTVVYYSNSYDLELRSQSEDRCHRIGQTESVTYVDLMVPGTLDGKIVEALRRKINVAAEILGDGYKEWLI